MPTTLWFAEACPGVLDGVGLRDAAKYVAVSSILGLYGCVLGFGGVYHGMLVSEILILGAHLGWQYRLWARWTPLDGQERDDLNPGDPPLRIRCRSASIGL